MSGKERVTWAGKTKKCLYCNTEGEGTKTWKRGRGGLEGEKKGAKEPWETSSGRKKGEETGELRMVRLVLLRSRSTTKGDELRRKKS